MPWTDLTDMADLVAWYKADALTGLSDTDPVTSWADSSGNSYDLSDATGGVYVASAVNSLPSVKFTNQKLQTGIFTHPGGDVMVTLVGKVGNSGTNQGFFRIGETAAQEYPNAKFASGWVYNPSTWATTGGRVFLGQKNQGTNDYAILSGLNYTDYAVITFRLGQLRRACVNGVSAGPSAAAGSQYPINGSSGDAVITLGETTTANYLSPGEIAEFVHYTDPDNEAWVEGYLADKYGITLTDGHLFKEAPPDSAPTTYNSVGGATLFSGIRGGIRVS